MNFFWNWLISKHEHVQLTAIDEFKLSLKTTAKCRFKAGIRVRKQGRFAYFSSILSSLCLIFISLLAMTDITLEPPRVYRRVDCLSQATLSDSVRLS